MPGRGVSIEALREAAWVARCVGRAEAAPLRDEDVVALAGYLEQRESARGSVLFKQGEPQAGVWVLRSGTVELTVANGRRPLVVQVLHPGDVDGDIALLLGRPPPYGAHALDDVVCLTARPAPPAHGGGPLTPVSPACGFPQPLRRGGQTGAHHPHATVAGQSPDGRWSLASSSRTAGPPFRWLMADCAGCTG